MIRSLDEATLDALREMSNVGAGHAATALAQMTGRIIQITIPEVRCLPLGEVTTALGEEEAPVAALHQRVYGDLRANQLLVFPLDLANRLLEAVAGSPPREPEGLAELTELESSALREVGNILGSAYLNAVSRLLGLTLIPTVPGLALDMAGAVAEHLVQEIGEVSDEALVLETALTAGQSDLGGRVYLLPHPDSLETLLGAIEESSR
jgi:chemotaxis protein CheC